MEQPTNPGSPANPEVPPNQHSESQECEYSFDEFWKDMASAYSEDDLYNITVVSGENLTTVANVNYYAEINK